VGVEVLRAALDSLDLQADEQGYYRVPTVYEQSRSVILRELQAGPKTFVAMHSTTNSVSVSSFGAALRELRQQGIVRKDRARGPAVLWSLVEQDDERDEQEAA
jgi:DNA-binding HxlR family transcriptional regulator